MKSHTSHQTFHTAERMTFINITDMVQTEVRVGETGIKAGNTWVNCPARWRLVVWINAGCSG